MHQSLLLASFWSHCLRLETGYSVTVYGKFDTQGKIEIITIKFSQPGTAPRPATTRVRPAVRIRDLLKVLTYEEFHVVAPGCVRNSTI